MTRWIHRRAALVVLAVVLTGCGGSAGSSSPGAAALVPSVPAGSAPAASPAPPRFSLADAKGDIVDGKGQKAVKQPAVDITRLTASIDGTTLRLDLTLAGPAPVKLSAGVREVTYLFVIEANRSGVDDFWVTITNTGNGGWSAKLSDWTAGLEYVGDRFPGKTAVAASGVSVTVPLVALASPSGLRISAVARVRDHKTGAVLAEDQAPKGEKMRPNADWLTLAIQ
jgi:hypothetical protein